jgi:hypothetical protein
MNQNGQLKLRASCGENAASFPRLVRSRPDQSGLSPGFGSGSPDFECHSPGFKSCSPKFETFRPDFGNDCPDFERSSHEFLQGSPGFVDSSPEFGKSSPDFFQVSPDFLSLPPILKAPALIYLRLPRFLKPLKMGDLARFQAAEQRTAVAHSASYGNKCRRIFQAPAGATENKGLTTHFFRPVRGLNRFVILSHGCHRGLLSCAAPQLQIPHAHDSPEIQHRQLTTRKTWRTRSPIC